MNIINFPKTIKTIRNNKKFITKILGNSSKRNCLGTRRIISDIKDSVDRVIADGIKKEIKYIDCWGWSSPENPGKDSHYIAYDIKKRQYCLLDKENKKFVFSITEDGVSSEITFDNLSAFDAFICGEFIFIEVLNEFCNSVSSDRA